MKFRPRWQPWSARPTTPAGTPAGSEHVRVASTLHGRILVAAIALLASWLAFTILYRFAILPYLLVAVLLTSLWRRRAGAYCLVASLVAMALAVLSEPTPPWRDGLEDMLRLTLLGLVAMGARSVLDGMERQRHTERRLIAELAEALAQLQASERQQALVAQALAERNRDLQEAQEQLLRSARLAALGQFSATVAHELRSPLNVVKLAVHYVTTHVPTDDEKLVRSLSNLNQNVDRAGDIINDLLAFARFPPPQRRLNAVDEMLRAAVAGLPARENVAVELSLASDLPHVMADARQIEQALINLGMNALQAMSEGGRLMIGARRKTRCVEITVRDTGPGIPESLRARVFEPFFSTKAGGTGLGLPLVQEIALAHGGHLSLESAPGEGACFTLALPLAEASSARTEPAGCDPPHAVAG
jgi:signal transduction histidine kinase